MLMYFRVKHFERYVGIFIVLALALAVLAFIFLGRGQHWFAKRSRYAVVFNKVQGMKMGTPVTISGMEVGSVQSLRLTPQSKVELTLEVLQAYQGKIRKDSQAAIASSLIGGKTVEITAGSPDQPPLPSGSVLPVEVKAARRPAWGDVPGLHVFLREYGELALGGLVLHGGTETYALGPTVVATPWWRVV